QDPGLELMKKCMVVGQFLWSSSQIKVFQSLTNLLWDMTGDRGKMYGVNDVIAVVVYVLLTE
ncbi:hypothetical protein LINPERHAP1_LOCUS38757, partial [Linum perenne]